MTTTYYEKITEKVANDETQLKKCVQEKVCESNSINDNWLNASIRYGYPGSWKLTPEYISVLVLDKEWQYYTLTNIKPDHYPRVVLFKPPAWKKTFSSVKTRDERKVVLWELHDNKSVPTEDIYAGLVPAGCAVEFLHVDVKYLGPQEISGHKGEPITGPSTANKRSGDLGDGTPKQPGVVDGASE